MYLFIYSEPMHHVTFSLKYKYILFVALTIALLFVYRSFNPEHTGFFPRCPFYSITGYQCPGCGSQRAIHYLLNFEFKAAVNENLLMVLFIPYLIAAFIFNSFRNLSPGQEKWRRFLFGQYAIYLVIVVIIIFWIARNL